jgi:hypothetical protein
LDKSVKVSFGIYEMNSEISEMKGMEKEAQVRMVMLVQPHSHYIGFNPALWNEVKDN